MLINWNKVWLFFYINGTKKTIIKLWLTFLNKNRIYTAIYRNFEALGSFTESYTSSTFGRQLVASNRRVVSYAMFDSLMFYYYYEGCSFTPYKYTPKFVLGFIKKIAGLIIWYLSDKWLRGLWYSALTVHKRENRLKYSLKIERVVVNWNNCKLINYNGANFARERACLRVCRYEWLYLCR